MYKANSQWVRKYWLLRNYNTFYHNAYPRVELEEDDSSHKDLRPSETARFNSAALPRFNSTEVHRHFTIGYKQDPVSKQFDLSKASVKFDTAFLTFASCIKHIEVTGKQKSGAARLKSRQPAPTTKPPTSTTPMPAGDGLRDGEPSLRFFF